MGQRSITRFLLVCGVIGPVLFIIVFLVEGATRPGYSAWRHAVSQLSLGEQGWINIANLVVCGLLLLGFSFGLRRVLRSGKGAAWGPRLAALCGVLLMIPGDFVVDTGLGYPPGIAPHYTLHGPIHAIAGTLLFGCLAALCVVLARRFAGDPAWKGWAPYSIATGVMVAVLYVATAVVTNLDASGALLHAPSGLLQRIALIGGLGWIALLALRLLRQGQTAEPGAGAVAARPQ
jgi:hypothetical membrane protein